MFFRRLIPLLLVALLLTACGNDDDDGTQPAAVASSLTATATQPVATAQATLLAPTATTTLPSTATAASEPTTASEPTATEEPEPTATAAPEPTATPEPAPSPTPEPTPTPEPSGPVVVRTGVLQTINYDGSGSVTVVRNPDGSHTIQFSDFQTEDGPGLVVYLSTATELSDGAILSADNVNLGDLQSTSGYQEYYVSPDIDPSAYASVVVWCADFDTGYVGAVLE